MLAGVSHPLRRYTLSLANEPLYLAAVIAIVALPWLASANVAARTKQKPVWIGARWGRFSWPELSKRWEFCWSSWRLSVGHVVVVSPIVATSPLWIVLGTWLFLRDVERPQLAHGGWRDCRGGGNDGYLARKLSGRSDRPFTISPGRPGVDEEI